MAGRGGGAAWEGEGVGGGGGGRIKVYNEFVRGTKLMVVEMAVSDLHARIMG